MEKNLTKTPVGYTDASFAKMLTDMGYRKVSNRHLMVARIDHPDWVEHLANKMRLAPADFVVRDGSGQISADWCDHYRRCYSEDEATVSNRVFRLMKSSGNDKCGFIPPDMAAKPLTEMVKLVWI